jgi:formate--tetrahydrofolate ligase
VVSRHFSEGGRGASELAEAAADATSQQSDFKMLCPADASLREKIETLAVKASRRPAFPSPQTPP